MLSLPSYIFYLNYLRPTIENGIKCNANFFDIENRDQFQYMRINDEAKIGIVPLPESNDKYLCI
jgi:hypothetical protein